jgi:O-antigen/teichoic acid export membrane protein
MNSVNEPINSIAFPMFSRLQDSPERCKVGLRHSIKISIFFVAPLMTGLAIVAHPLILLLFGEKWLPAVPFLRIMAIVYIFYPIHSLNLGAITGIRRTDIFLRCEIIKKVLGIAIMFSFMPFGLFWFVCSHLIGTVFSILINTLPLNKLIGYSPWEQILDISKSLIGSTVMALILLPLCHLNFNVYTLLAIQIPLGASVYLMYYYFFDKITLIDNYLLFSKSVLKRG